MFFLPTLPFAEARHPLQVRYGTLSGILQQAGLDSFEALWEVPHIFVEPINRRRGGWSGVSKLTLPDEKRVLWHLVSETAGTAETLFSALPAGRTHFSLRSRCLAAGPGAALACRAVAGLWHLQQPGPEACGTADARNSAAFS